MISAVYISSSSISISSFLSNFSPYISYKFSLIFFYFNNFNNSPVVLVSSHAITSAPNNALSYLIDQSFKFPFLLISINYFIYFIKINIIFLPIGVGHIVNIPLGFYYLPISK